MIQNKSHIFLFIGLLFYHFLALLLLVAVFPLHFVELGDMLHEREMKMANKRGE